MVLFHTRLLLLKRKTMNNYIGLFLKIFFLTILLNSCDNREVYKVGNRLTLDFVIDTKISFKVIRNYIGKMAANEFQAPEKWQGYKKLVDIDSVNSFRIYFKATPEEMYLIQFNGELLLADVLNENIVKGDWVTNRDNLSSADEERIKRRFTVEILDKIEKMAKEDGIPDSVLFYKPYN